MALPLVNARNDIASRRIVYLSTVSQGNGEVFRVEKVDFKDESQTEMINEVGNQDAAGFRDKPGGNMISVELYEQQGLSWPDWDALKASKEPVTLVDQVVGGRRRSFGPARVSKIDRSGSKDGENTISVEIAALTRQDL